MTLWIAIVLGVVLIALFIGLFSLLTNPQEIDAEEEADVIKEKKPWWRWRR